MSTINKHCRCYAEVMECMDSTNDTFTLAEYIIEYNGMIIFDDSYTGLVTDIAERLKMLPNMEKYRHDFIKLTLPYRHWVKQKYIASLLSTSLGNDLAQYISEMY